MFCYPLNSSKWSTCTISQTNPSILRNSTGSKKQIRDTKWKLTVLEAYWELGARKGTKMTARSSTFSSFRCFRVFETVCFSFSEKTGRPPLENQTFITLQLERCEGDVRENAEKSSNYCHDGHPPLLCQSSVLRVSALKIWSQSERYSTYWLDHKLTL